MPPLSILSEISFFLWYQLIIAITSSLIKENLFWKCKMLESRDFTLFNAKIINFKFEVGARRLRARDVVTSAATSRCYSAYPFLEANQIFSDYKYLVRWLAIHSLPVPVRNTSWSRILSSAQDIGRLVTEMESFLDPKVEQLLAKKSDTERLQAIAFSIACLCTGPTPFQPPDYFHIPRSKGKYIIEVIYTVSVTVCETSNCDTCIE